MRPDHESARPGNGANGGSIRLSYKFQRLREQIRAAIASGEFQNRLPGERALGRRYQANAKTINKALCDLSREGLLVRHIGRGTFVAKDLETAERKQPACDGCFCPEARAASPQQAAILERLRRAEAASGRVLRQFDSRSGPAAGSVRLADWPSRSRRATDALFFIPRGPLDRPGDAVGEDLILEACRRRVPLLVLGAATDMPKLNAVVPDYVDAGYRLAEHVCRMGCRAIIAAFAGRGREVDAVLTGCRTAAERYRIRFDACRGERSSGKPAAEAILARLSASGSADGDGPSLGVVCIGAGMLAALRENHRVWRHRISGDLAVTCAADPADPAAESLGVTSYDVDPAPVAAWGTRLAGDLRPGQRPVEVVIPGRIRIRHAPPFEAQASSRLGASIPAAREAVTEVAI
ncbi:MAG: GntR family transcriptional regulator [Phycisphaerae bacterium]